MRRMNETTSETTQPWRPRPNAGPVLVYCLVRGGGGCEIRTREGLPPTRFPTMLARVHRRPPPSANCTNTIRANTGERSRTEVNETETETECWALFPNQRARGPVSRERRGDLLGAKPGSGPGRPEAG